MNDSPAPSVVNTEGEWAIAATAATALSLYRPRTLKCGDTFLVLDHYGDAQAIGNTAEGLFHDDARHLSRMSLRLGGIRPLLLSSAVSQDNALLSINMTNPDLHLTDGTVLKRDTLHLQRKMVLGPGVVQERLYVENFGDKPLSFEISLTHSADFADIFEVRGMKRARRGERHAVAKTGAGIRLGYTGLDGVTRQTELTFEPRPARHQGRESIWLLALEPGESWHLAVTIRCLRSDRAPEPVPDFDMLLDDLRRWTMRRVEERAMVHTSNAAFNDWVHRSQADLAMLTTSMPQGPFPYAGIPWFSCPFGRDSLISALQCLWVDPFLARGTLRFLAAHQAETLDPKRDAEPGKILHEMRRGEMAALGEVPFGQYYGSVDSTPLFVVLAAAYAERSGDLATIREIWPAVVRALSWMEAHGGSGEDGLLRYDRRSVNGLVNQGWKDSFDSVFHADGRLADAPIALIEVQAYAEAAWRGAAQLAGLLGVEEEAAGGWLARAGALRETVDRLFWCEELGTYALALDGENRPCRVRNSNAGHALLTGLALPERAAQLAETLLDPRSFCGWGIRTIPEGEARYNPMSYHNGSVWPHDNGLIAMGLKRYGMNEALERIASGLFDTALAVDMKRLPELFCGFPRIDAEGPTAYPVACLPQAWAAASAFAVIGAMLGISFRPEMRVIRFVHPVLPPWLEELRIDNLTLNDASVDVRLRRHGTDGSVSLNVLGRRGHVEVAVIT